MLIRYPGSKDRAVGQMLPLLALTERRLCEPFAGTAAVSFAALRHGLLDEVWLNDVDRGITDLWSTVRDDPEALVQRLLDYTPRVEDFYDWRDRDFPDPVENAFATVVLHQISYSGLGRKAGSPIGGRDQNGEYPVGCRWNGARLAAGVRQAHRALSRASVTITTGDWRLCPEWAWYVDPPYYVAGAGLYRHGELDHVMLSVHLQRKSEPWLLSYDDVAAVRHLYEWAHFDAGHDTYLNHGGAKRKTELLIRREPFPAAVVQPVLFAL